MKAGIVGAGALGALFAHIFQRAGIPFSIYEKDQSVVDEVNSLGLTLNENDIIDIIHPSISTKPGILTDADVIMLFVKSYSTEDAVKDVVSSIKNDSIIVSLQNGLGNFEAISKHVNSDRIVLGTTTIGATKTGLSSVSLGGKGAITIGSSSADSTERADNLFSKAGLQFTRVFNPHIAVWKKAVINAGINPIAAILDIKNGDILQIPYAMELQKRVVTESVKAAKAAGIPLDTDSMLKEVSEICLKTSANICSMLQDIHNGRKTEIDSIIGAVIETAARHNTPSPVSETLYLLIKGLESKKTAVIV
jgi:2-dehydropantoate 2-reductase